MVRVSAGMVERWIKYGSAENHQIRQAEVQLSAIRRGQEALQTFARCEFGVETRSNLPLGVVESTNESGLQKGSFGRLEVLTGQEVIGDYGLARVNVLRPQSRQDLATSDLANLFAPVLGELDHAKTLQALAENVNKKVLESGRSGVEWMVFALPHRPTDLALLATDVEGPIG
jgi:hypothetical protein